MVVLDGVRYRKEDLALLHPDRVGEAVEETVAVEPVFDKVTTVPGGVVTEVDELGHVTVDTTDSAAANKPVVEATNEGGGDGVSGGASGTGDSGTAPSKRSGTRTSSNKGK